MGSSNHQTPADGHLYVPYAGVRFSGRNHRQVHAASSANWRVPRPAGRIPDALFFRGTTVRLRADLLACQTLLDPLVPFGHVLVAVADASNLQVPQDIRGPIISHS